MENTQSNTKAQYAMLRANGYISTAESGEILGIHAQGTCFDELAKSKVPSLLANGRGQGCRYWLKSAVEQLRDSRAKHVVGGDSNGGRLSARISELEARVSQIEARIASIEGVSTEGASINP